MYFLNKKLVSQNNKNFIEQLKAMERLVCENKICITEEPDGGQCTVVSDSCTICSDKSDKHKMELARRYAKVLKMITEYGMKDPNISHFLHEQ